VSTWLRTDDLASFFIFELGGFEFLLDTIGNKDDTKAVKDPASIEESLAKSNDQAQINSKSDITADIEEGYSDIYEFLDTPEPESLALDAKADDKAKENG
jgi:hypothetical protein